MWRQFSKIISIHCQQKLNRTKICIKCSTIRFIMEHVSKCSKWKNGELVLPILKQNL